MLVGIGIELYRFGNSVRHDSDDRNAKQKRTLRSFWRILKAAVAIDAAAATAGGGGGGGGGGTCVPDGLGGGGGGGGIISCAPGGLGGGGGGGGGISTGWSEICW
jgi:hypothetical protein